MVWDYKYNGIEDYLEILQEKGRNLVVIIDPHLKIDKSYFIYSDAISNGKKIFNIDYLIKQDSYPYEGICWCKDAVYLDFYNLEVRDYWTKLHHERKDFFFNSTNIHIWNDMNEPSVFEVVDTTLPRSTTFNYYNTTYEHRDAHNLYGYLMHKTSYNAMKTKYMKRPFVLTRSFYIGSHKYGAVWNGDMRSTFSDMKLSLDMILQLSISGYSFVGADVGGFTEEGEHYLYVRWYQLGIFYPFFRAHSQNEVKRREPWLYDTNTLYLIRDSIILRYKLLPYIYSCFYDHNKTGMPILKPLWFKYPDSDSKFHNNQFFFGDSIMVRPVLYEREHFSEILNLYLTENERWYDLYSYVEIKQKNIINYKISHDKIGAFIKGGCIIPMKWRLRRSSAKAKYDPITLIIALNNENCAEGKIYFDDEETYDYENNTYSVKKIIFKNNEIYIEDIYSNYKIQNKIERIVILGINPPVSVQIDNKQLSFENKESNIIHINRLQLAFNEKWKIIVN